MAPGAAVASGDPIPYDVVVPTRIDPVTGAMSSSVPDSLTSGDCKFAATTQMHWTGTC